MWEKAPGRIEERFYLAEYEVYRKHTGPISSGIAVFERETLHVTDGKQRVALIETRTHDTGGNDQAPARLIRYQFGNHLGSTTLELDEKARIITYEEYAPFGSTTYQAVRGRTRPRSGIDIPGMERDEESGLCFHLARYYSPMLARWASADPVGLIDGPNLYRYARDNPVVLSDPDGLTPSVIGSEEFIDPQTYETTVADRAQCISPGTDQPGLLDQAAKHLMESNSGQLILGLVMGGLGGAAPWWVCSRNRR